MIYMLGIYLIVAIPVFALAGAVLLTMIVISKLKDSVRGYCAMRIPCSYTLRKNSPIFPS